MATFPKFDLDLKAWFEGVSEQFRGLDSKDPSSWPTLPRRAVFVFLAAVCVAIFWYFLLSDKQVELTTEQQKELSLRDEFKVKLTKAVSLEALKKQREQVQQYVTQLEKQLPSKSEMDALLSDINQAGIGRSLQFELFRPGQVAAKEYYAELPIAVRVTGRYHDIGAFAADIANLSRIVTINNMSVVPAKDGVLALDATAKTFRYLDAEEVNAQRKAVAPGAKK